MDYIGNTHWQSFNTNSFNNLNILHQTIWDDKAQVLQWLSSLEPQKRQQHLVENRLEGVGQWIFGTREFRRWNEGGDKSAHTVLFCHGDPGVGKTYLSSLVIDHFYGSGQNIAVAGLYCDYLDRAEQTTAKMLGAMLKQLVGGGEIPEDIRKAFGDAKGHFGGVGPRVPELLNMLKTAIVQRQRVIICIDGLDELHPAHRSGLLSSLQAIVRELPNVRLFLTGRPFIRGEVEKHFPGVDTIPVSPTREDTEALLRMKLDSDTEPDAMDDRLRADIMETIPKRISEIFLLVSLSIDAILAEPTIHQREEKLKQISKGQGIGDLYTATLARIRAQEPARSRLGMKAIMWVAHSERPLRPEELCQALGVGIGSQDLISRNAPSIRTILSCGLGLITVDSSSSTVRLVHFTLQEYILANPTLFPSPHSAIAEACLTYLNFRCIRDLSPALSSPPPITPFLEYASCYWGAHARRETNAGVISLALNLLGQFDTHISCKLLVLKECEGWPPLDAAGKPTGFTGLHGGALIGVVEIMVYLFEMERWDLNATDLRGFTPLARATSKGHDGVVKKLLEQKEVKPDAAGDGDPTPLSVAAANGHERIVEMLLERSDVNPGAADESGRTSLTWAAMFGYEEIVRMLLERNEVNPDTVDESGKTPLSWAAMSQHEEIVEILVKRKNSDSDTPDGIGGTLFPPAATGEQEGIAEMPSDRKNINPETADDSGQTPRPRDAENGLAGTGKLLESRRDSTANSTLRKESFEPFTTEAPELL